jgi:SWI/SNF-related matrix-associated actin-dependent regulator 1 of chromatin subfamily A
MQISKISVTVCATALCCAVTGGQAFADTPAQAAAIAALRQKAQAEDAASANAPATAPAATSVPATPAQAAAINAVRQQAQAADNAQPAPTPIVVDAAGVVSPRDPVADAALAQAVAEAQDAARQRADALQMAIQRQTEMALQVRAEMQKKADLTDAQSKADADALYVKQQQAAVLGQTSTDNATKKAADDLAAAQAQAAAQAKAVADAAAQKSADQAAAQVKAAEAAANAAYYPGKELGFKPIQTPASPISTEKQAQLDALLVKYQADQVTPEEYHQQRAAILAQP